MKIITLSIYSLEEKKNWKKGGFLSKRAIPTKGSYTETLQDQETSKVGEHINNVLCKLYRDIHTGYIDNVIKMRDDNGNFYVGYLSMTNSTFPDGVTLGFSKYLHD